MQEQQENKDTTAEFIDQGLGRPEDSLQIGDIVDFKGIKGVCAALQNVPVVAICSHMVNTYLLEHPQGFNKKQFIEKIEEGGFEDGFENFHSSELEEGKTYVIAMPQEVTLKKKKNNENTKKMKFSVLHVPTWGLQKFETQEEAEKAILQNEKSLPASEFMALRETLRDLIIIKLVELKQESQGETPFSPFFITVIEATYTHFTSRDSHENGFVKRATLVGIAKELHQLNMIYTDELKYEKLNIEELAINIDNWIEAVDDMDAQARMNDFIQWVQKTYDPEQLKAVKGHLDTMMETQEMTKDEPTYNILDYYNTVIWSIPFISEKVSESLDVEHKDTNLTHHVQTWVHKMLTL